MRSIGEINNELRDMPQCSAARFYRFLIDNGVYTSNMQAKQSMSQYGKTMANASSIIRRIKVAILFEEWIYKYGGSRRKKDKQQIIDKANIALDAYWSKTCHIER